MKQIRAAEAIVCIISSQIANVGESLIGAALQEKEGFQWVGNHSNDYLVSLHTNCSVSLVCLHSHELHFLHCLCSVLQLDNNAVNIINISMGSIIAILIQQAVFRI